ncbi:hypothetical protein [Arenimonas oryziterrae]|nr:hypothetical protein [Arenimonas oryziterrae]
MLAGFAAAVTTITTDLGTVGAGLVTIGLVSLGITLVVRRFR